MTINHITDMVDNTKARLIEQFKDKENIDKIIELFVEEIQEVEDAVIEILTDLTLSNATGANLDIVGEHLGRRRFGETDSVYRDILRLQVGINISNGAEQPLYDVFKLLTNSSISIITETFPAEIQIFGDGDTIDANIIKQLRQVVAATVEINFLLSGGNRPFAFAGGELLGGGFSDSNITPVDAEAAGYGAFSTVISGA